MSQGEVIFGVGFFVLAGFDYSTWTWHLAIWRGNKKTAIALFISIPLGVGFFFGSLLLSSW